MSDSYRGADLCHFRSKPPSARAERERAPSQPDACYSLDEVAELYERPLLELHEAISRGELVVHHSKSTAPGRSGGRSAGSHLRCTETALELWQRVEQERRDEIEHEAKR